MNRKLHLSLSVRRSCPRTIKCIEIMALQRLSEIRGTLLRTLIVAHLATPLSLTFLSITILH